MTEIIDIAKAPLLAFCEGNWAQLRSCLHDQVIYDEVASQVKTVGIEPMLAGWVVWKEAFPDVRCTFDSAHVTNTVVTLELSWQATHTQPMATPDGYIPATGKPVDFRGRMIIGVEGDKVSFIHNYTDQKNMLLQLGLLQPA